jgi:acyl-CoA-binding protein
MKPQGIFAEKEKRKWDAWNKMKDKESNEAMILYIEKVKSLQIE